MFCVDKKKGFELEDRGAATEIQFIGSITLQDINYVKRSDINSLDLSRAYLEIIGNFNISFRDCIRLNKITLPKSLKCLGESAFEDCKSLISIEIPNDVNSIGRRAFYGCSSLVSIKLPSGIVGINSNAFENCSSLKTINIPPNIREIQAETFKGCSSLTTLNIPNSVTLIKDYAFANCDSLTLINLPNEITFKENAVSYCQAKLCYSVMLFCDCGSCYPEYEQAKHSEVKCDCNLFIKKCCIDKHRESDSQHKELKCGHCGDSYQRYLGNKHLKQTCTYCKSDYCKTQQAKHENKKCVSMTPNNSGTNLVSSSTDNQTSEKTVAMPIAEFRHKNSSEQEMPFECSNKEKGCEFVVPSVAENENKELLLKLHLKYVCLFEKVRGRHEYQFCPFASEGCNFLVISTILDPATARENIATHLANDCPFMPLKCINKECSKYIERYRFEGHSENCVFTIKNCKHCGKSVPKINDHIQYECSNTHCKNDQYGCDYFSLNRCKLMIHENKCMVKHCYYCHGTIHGNVDLHVQNDCKNTHCKNIAQGCAFYSVDKNELIAHETGCKPETLVFACEFCSKEQKGQINLKKHHLWGCEKNMCSVCKKRHFTISSLVLHIIDCNK